MPDWNERYQRGEHVNYEPAPLLTEAAEKLLREIFRDWRILHYEEGGHRHAPAELMAQKP
jgi:hypothetical protein